MPRHGAAEPSVTDGRSSRRDVTSWAKRSWASRALGAASLECCAVAQGVLDAYLPVGRSTLYGWDYLAGLLVCREAGVAAAERDGRDLIARDDTSRRPIVAATTSLAAQLAEDSIL